MVQILNLLDNNTPEVNIRKFYGINMYPISIKKGTNDIFFITFLVEAVSIIKNELLHIMLPIKTDSGDNTDWLSENKIFNNTMYLKDIDPINIFTSNFNMGDDSSLFRMIKMQSVSITNDNEDNNGYLYLNKDLSIRIALFLSALLKKKLLLSVFLPKNEIVFLSAKEWKKEVYPMPDIICFNSSKVVFLVAYIDNKYYVLETNQNNYKEYINFT